MYSTIIQVLSLCIQFFANVFRLTEHIQQSRSNLNTQLTLAPVQYRFCLGAFILHVIVLNVFGSIETKRITFCIDTKTNVSSCTINIGVNTCDIELGIKLQKNMLVTSKLKLILQKKKWLLWGTKHKCYLFDKFLENNGTSY